jgi:nucleoid-associated protein YgaU
MALRFGVTVNKIATVNGIKNPDLIYAGQILTIYPRIVR